MKRKNQVITTVITAVAIAALFIAIVPMLDSNSDIRGNALNNVQYNVIFQNYNNEVLYTTRVHNGESVAYPKDAPVKNSGNSETRYVFMGWEVLDSGEKSDNKYDIELKDNIIVDSNKICRAIYSESVDYTVTFKNYDDTSISTKSVTIGSPLVAPSDPVRSADLSFTYAFVGWDINSDGVADTLPTRVLENITAKALFISTYIDYTITFRSEGVELDKKEHEHYDALISAPSDPIKTSTLENKYTFAGWDSDGDGNADPLPSRVTASMTFDAVFTAEFINYTVKFLDYDYTELYSNVSAHYGDTITAPLASRSSDLSYTYTFAGWDTNGDGIAETIPDKVNGDLLAIALYDIEAIDYVVTFKNSDGSEISKNAAAHYGDTITVPAQTVIPTNDAQYTYTFTGWDTNDDGNIDVIPTTVEGNLTAKAIYSRTVNTYNVTFLDAVGNEIYNQDHEYGVYVDDLLPVAPLKASDSTYDYTFLGWDINDDGIVDSLHYILATDILAKPIYTATAIEYTITWLDFDDTQLHKDSYIYNAPITIPSNPTRAEDMTGSYIFAGWDTNGDGVANISDTIPLNCKGNYVYKATYNTTYKTYTASFDFNNGIDGVSTSSYHYEDTLVVPADPVKPADAEYTYTFVGWDLNGDNVYNSSDVMPSKITANINAKAIFSTTVNQYTIEFLDTHGNVYSTKTADYGTMLDTLKPTDPTQDSDSTYTYSFAGWDINTDNVVDDLSTIPLTEDVVADPKFTSNYIDYNVNFLSDGVAVAGGAQTYHYLDTLVKPADPVKAEDEVGSYTFKGWDTNDDGIYNASDVLPSTVTENLTFNAIYDITYKLYSVSFDPDNGSTDTISVFHYGQAYPDPGIPVKGDAQFVYTFIGWDLDNDGDVDADDALPETVTKNIDAIAIYSKVTRQYNVVFKDAYDNDISNGNYDYGTNVESLKPSTPPVKTPVAGIGYSFYGWDADGDDDCDSGDNINLGLAKDYVLRPVYIAYPIDYSITFLNYSGGTISSYSTTTARYGDTISQPTNDLIGIPANTLTTTYTFMGWDINNDGNVDPIPATVTGDLTAKPIINSSAALSNYNVDFKNGETFTIMEHQSLPSGSHVTYGGVVPTKEATTTEFYTWEWDQDLSTYTVTSDAIITGNFVAHEYTELFNFVDTSSDPDKDIYSEPANTYGLKATDALKSEETLGYDIPETIYVGGTVERDGVIYTVNSIKTQAFYNNDSFHYLNIDPSVIHLEDYCLQGGTTTNLDEINFDITSVLSGYRIPTGFAENQTKLCKVTIPASTSSIGEKAFYNCSTLKEVNFDSATNIEGFEADCFNGCNLIDVNIKDTPVFSIFSGAFANNNNLESIIIPDSVINIEKGAFENCGGGGTGTIKIFFEYTDAQLASFDTIGNFESGWNDGTGGYYIYDESGTNNDGHHWHYDATGNPVIIS